MNKFIIERILAQPTNIYLFHTLHNKINFQEDESGGGGRGEGGGGEEEGHIGALGKVHQRYIYTNVFKEISLEWKCSFFVRGGGGGDGHRRGCLGGMCVVMHTPSLKGGTEKGWGHGKQHCR